MFKNFIFRGGLAAVSAVFLIIGSAAQALPMAPLEGSTLAQPELAPVQIRAGGRGGHGRPGGGHGRPGGGFHGGRPGVGRPGVGRPGVGRPGVGRPGVGRPGVGRPGVGRPVRPPVGGWHGGVWRGGAWVRPYRWAPGGAIAAGAAIGFVTAATAAAWASAPPQPGLCWYYTDPSRRNGFWDTCPR